MASVATIRKTNPSFGIAVASGRLQNGCELLPVLNVFLVWTSLPFEGIRLLLLQKRGVAQVGEKIRPCVGVATQVNGFF